MSTDIYSSGISKKITVFSLVAAVMMVFYHANADSNFSYIVYSNDFIGNVCRCLNLVGTSFGNVVLSFFFINSGFLLYYNMDKGNIWNKVKSRLYSLLMPVLIWNVIGFIYCYHKDFVQSLKTIDVLKEICKIIFSEYDGVMWFCEALALYSVMIPLAYPLLRKKYIGIILVIGSYLLLHSGIVYSGIIYIRDVEINIGRMNGYIPFYLFGAWLGVNYKESIMAERYRNKYTVAMSILAVIVIYLGVFISNDMGGILNFIPFLIWIIVPNHTFDNIKHWIWSMSFYIYAVHLFVLGKIKDVAFRIIDTSLPVTINWALGWRSVTCLITVIVAVCTGYILKKFLPKLYKLLTGGR